LLFSSLTSKTPTKNYPGTVIKKKFSAYFITVTLEGTVHLHNFSKIKSQKEVTKTVGIKVFQERPNSMWIWNTALQQYIKRTPL
jgi:hypothetical protein